MSEHDSHEDPKLSELYRRASQEEPSAQLDERVLAMARRHATRRSHRWWLPLSTAAVVVLAVSLLLRHQQAPDDVQQQLAQLAPAEPVAEAPMAAPAPAPRKREAVPAAPAPEAQHRAKPKVAEKPAPLAKSSVAEVAPAEAEKKAASPAETMLADEAAPAAPSADRLAETKQALRAVTPQAAAGAPLQSEAVVEAPEVWLKRIDVLRAKGELEEARRELTAFRKAYPGYTLPKELQALLPEGASNGTMAPSH